MTQEQSGVEHFFRTDDAGRGTVGDPGLGMVEPASLGGSLRALREARRWSLADVSARLKFGVRQIEALESERWDELPQGPSLRGLVRNYARLVEVDPDTLMNALPAHLQHRAVPVPNLAAVGGELPHSSLRYRDGSATRRPVWPKVVLAFILICVTALAAYLIFEWWLPRNAAEDAQAGGMSLSLAMQDAEQILPQESDVAIQPPAATAATGSAGLAVPGAEGRIAAPDAAAAQTDLIDDAARAPTNDLAPQPPVAPASAAVTGDLAPPLAQPPVVTVDAAPALPVVEDPSGPAPTAVLGNVLGFEVSAASWVEVRDASGSVVLSSTLQPGAREQVDVAAPARIIIGNAGGVTLTWRGSPVDLAGHQRGNVARLTLE